LEILKSFYMIARMTFIPRDWFDWTNFGIGFAGLGLTLWAVKQATGAKTAANRAERSLQRHNAEGDFAVLVQKASELYGFVENGKLPEARLRTADLRSDLAAAIGRHEEFLNSRIGQLREKQVDLKLMTEGLNSEVGALSNSERVRLLRITGAILELIAGQWGQLRSRAEKGVSNG